VQRDELGSNLHAVDLERQERTVWCAPTLRRAAGVEDPDIRVPGNLGHVRVSVDDGGAVRKRGDEALCTTVATPGVVHHPDPEPACVDEEPFGQRRLQLGFVDVSVHRPERRQRAQLVEGTDAREVARVQNEIGTRDQLDAFRREPPPAAGQVRVGEDGER
jgi:hypothetical protein